MPAKRANPRAVFLNLPYDREFEPLYLAYIAGIGSLRLIARVPLGNSGGERRLDRIFDLVRSCRYSIHGPLLLLPPGFKSSPNIVKDSESMDLGHLVAHS